MIARTFSSYEFPKVDQKSLNCVGVRLSDDMDAWLSAVAPFVTEAEQKRADEFVHKIDGIRHLIGRAIARRVLSATLGVIIAGDFSYLDFGKPYWPDSGIDFSITHSGDMVWVAFTARGKVGIDIETIQDTPDIPALAKQLHPEECAAVLCQPKDARSSTFYRCWTRKEAVLKACGTGLARSLKSFSVHTDDRKTSWLREMDTPPVARWTTYDIELSDDIMCSVASTVPQRGLTTSIL